MFDRNIFLLVANSASSIFNFRLDLIKAIQKKEQKVHVVCPDIAENSTEYQQLSALDVVVHQVPMSRAGLNPLADLYTCWCLFCVMRSVKPSRVLCYTIKPVIYGTLAAFFARVPQRYALISGLGYAFVEDSLGSKKRAFIRYIVQYLYGLALQFCQQVFFQNPDDEALFRDRGILSKKTMSTVVNGSGVNLEYFYPTPLPSNPVFLLIARLLIDKGVREYAEAARLIKDKYPKAEFKMVGYLDENPESITQQELDSWVEGGFIEYLGKLSDVRPALAASSVFVLPTFYREGIPRTILEALAMGRAIITTDTPGCRETVVNGQNGYLVESRSINSLVKAMEIMLEKPEKLESMAAFSLQMAKIQFDVNKVNSIMLKKMNF